VREREREREKDDCCIDTEISVISSDIFYWICSPVHILHSNSALLCVYFIKIRSLANSCGFYPEKEILIFLFFIF